MPKKNTAKQVNIRKYRKPLNLNIGMVIFAGIFIYVVICIILFFNQKHIEPHEVREGSLATTNVYRGVIIREETVVNCEAAGYVNYYAREGERVAVGNLVYAVDEADRLAELLNTQETDGNSLSTSDLKELRSDIVNFSHSFTPDHFDTVYDFKFSVEGTVLKLANAGIMELLGSIDDSSQTAEFVSFCRAQSSGIVMYWIDGYEDLTPETVTKEVFDNKEYEKKQLINNELLASGDAAYKLCTNENWSVVIPIEQEWGRELEEEEYVKVRFQKTQEEAWAKVKLYFNADENYYLQLTFTNSMISFVTDRFLDVELILHDEKGLKIPNSSIVEKEFILIPEAYLIENGTDKSYSVLREAPLENGTLSTELVSVTVYNKSEEEDGTVYYYVDDLSLRNGDRLCMPDSTQQYVVSRRGTLVGVYNMNKGYADFRRIIILYQNDEYSIVQSNTDYGLNVYDFIVLDASAVNENDFIYE